MDPQFTNYDDNSLFEYKRNNNSNNNYSFRFLLTSNIVSFFIGYLLKYYTK